MIILTVYIVILSLVHGLFAVFMFFTVFIIIFAVFVVSITVFRVIAFIVIFTLFFKREEKTGAPNLLHEELSLRKTPMQSFRPSEKDSMKFWLFPSGCRVC